MTFPIYKYDVFLISTWLFNTQNALSLKNTYIYIINGVYNTKPTPKPFEQYFWLYGSK